MLDLMQALHHAPSTDTELSGLMLSDEELGELGLEQLEHNADAAVMAIMLPGTLSEDEQGSPRDQEQDELDSLWSAALGEPQVRMNRTRSRTRPWTNWTKIWCVASCPRADRTRS